MVVLVLAGMELIFFQVAGVQCIPQPGGGGEHLFVVFHLYQLVFWVLFLYIFIIFLLIASVNMF